MAPALSGPTPRRAGRRRCRRARGLAVARETIELASLVAVQHLAPRPRAVLILRDGLTALLREDVRCSMPPAPGLQVGRDAVVAEWERDGFAELGRMRAVPTAANRQPVVGFYLWHAGQRAYLPLTVDVLRIAEITTFHADRFPRLGLPDRLSYDVRLLASQKPEGGWDQDLRPGSRRRPSVDELGRFEVNPDRFLIEHVFYITTQSGNVGATDTPGGPARQNS